jgi:hypothetical protein
MASTIPQHTLPTDSIPFLPPTSTSVETDLLIVGAGPAGASLACFLARYSLKGLMISSAPGTADTPRAHMNNEAALECLRDIGLWEECKKLGHAGDYIKHFRYVWICLLEIRMLIQGVGRLLSSERSRVECT